MKPGYKTTEFWLTLAVVTLAAWKSSGLFADESVTMQVIAVALAVLAALGYTAVRAKVKTGSLMAANEYRGLSVRGEHDGLVSVMMVIIMAVTQLGKEYVFGAKASHNDPDPRAFDCSELIEWICAILGVKPRMPDGSWHQVSHCRRHGLLISVDEAIDTRGALLFRFEGGDPFSGKRPHMAHVALSLGNGRTVEARSITGNVCIATALDRGWTHAALIPGVRYEDTATTEMSLAA